MLFKTIDYVRSESVAFEQFQDQCQCLVLQIETLVAQSRSTSCPDQNSRAICKLYR